MPKRLHDWSPKKAWRLFRLEAEAAKHYWRSYFMYSMQTHRDPLLEQILPTLLYVKAVAILDDALGLWLDQNGYRLQKKYRNDLNGRISFFHDKSLLSDTDALHAIRERRNNFAHGIDVYCLWPDLERDVSTIETSLVSLGLVSDTPKLEYFCERSKLEASDEPGIDCVRQFSYGIKENGRMALKFGWEQKLHSDGNS